MIARMIVGRRAVSVPTDGLLGRKVVAPDPERMRGYLGGKRVMVTGAGGSIGAELCRQICRANPEGLLMLDQGESSLGEIDLDIGEHFPGVSRIAQLADIRWTARMEEIFAEFRPHVVFHAAAFKHVPLLEAHPREVVLNNIVATAHLARLALAHETQRFGLISSDKAVNPVSIMGASKRVAELYMQHLSRTPTRFLAVRFGNVLGSAGSVLPRIRQQVERGGPVTITHPQMSRYFMTAPEAVQSVIEAAAIASGGEIFIPDMGEPVHVVDLVRKVVALAGLELGRDIGIAFTGVRPGEKLEEELWSSREHPAPTAHPGIKVIRNHGVPNGADLDAAIEDLRGLAEHGQVQRMMDRLQSLVPEFTVRSARPAGGKAAAAGRFRVLVADDDADMREVMRRALQGAGLEVTTAGDGVAALEEIRATPPDLAILDLRMPRLDGLALFERLKRDPSTRPIPVLLVTAHAELGEATRAIPFAAADFLSKPFRLPDFVGRVNGILQRQRTPRRMRTAPVAG